MLGVFVSLALCVSGCQIAYNYHMIYVLRLIEHNKCGTANLCILLSIGNTKRKQWFRLHNGDRELLLINAVNLNRPT